MADETMWVLSNRVDDRVVLWERDRAHPGGEAFVASSTPARVAKTPEVERLLRAGMLVEVAEPLDGDKKPLDVEAVNAAGSPDGPGRPTRLGRAVPEGMFSEAAVKKIEQAQEGAPREVPVPAGVVVPPEAPAESTRTRR